MDKIIDLLRLMKNNHSTDIIYFERIIEKEINKPVEIFIENEKITLYHKVTGTYKGNYIPSDDFIKLANAFIEYNKPTIRVYQSEYIKLVFAEFNVKKSAQ